MAKETKNETRTSLDDLNDSLVGIEQKVQENKKGIMWVCIGVAAVVCLVLVYFYAIRQPGIAAANDAIGQADMSVLAGNDSIALTQYKQVADEYGYDAGNRAALNAAIILYKDGKYQEALDYLKKFKGSESIIGASAKSLEGDCYVNLKKYDDAVKCFAEAAKISDDNPSYTPVFLMKEATVLRELKKYKEEAAIYQKIIDEYPAYGGSINVDMDKYLRRAQIAAGEE